MAKTRKTTPLISFFKGCAELSFFSFWFDLRASLKLLMTVQGLM